MGDLRQFESMTAYEFVYHHPINDESKERAVSCISLSIYRRFWAFEVGLYSVNGAYNFCACGVFLVPRGCVQSTMQSFQVLRDVIKCNVIL